MGKPIAIAVLSLLMLCCQKRDAEFRGFGDLLIGADFASVKHSDKFEETTSGEYYMLKYELSEKFGPVSGVYVVTNDGKISEVRFSSEDNTNLDAMKESCAGMLKVEPKILTAYSQLIDIYMNKDSTLFMGVSKREEGFNKKKLRYDFRYSDKHALEANHRRIMKNLVVPQTPGQGS